MRTLLAGELNTALQWNSQYYVKLEVQNGSGTWIDVGAALGELWTLSFQWGEDINTVVSQATITLIQQIDANSLAPLISASVLNKDDTGAYSPLLEIGRLIRFSTATMDNGTPLDTSKYREMFTGRIDDVQSADDPDLLGPITIICSDLGGWLQDIQVETSGIQYGGVITAGSFVVGESYVIVSIGSTDFTTIGAASNTVGLQFTATGVGSGTGTVNPSLETVLQNVLNGNIPVGEPAVTLVKESTSNFAVTNWQQGQTKLLDGLTTLVLDSVGEDIRYRYDASHISQFMWFNPDRNRVTVDATIPLGYYALALLDHALADVRNAGRMAYTDVNAGTAGVVTSVDPVSSAPTVYRRRFFQIAPTALITSEASAQALLDSVVHDLSTAPATATDNGPYKWFVQLYDRYTYPANGRSFDQDQTFTVVAYQHNIVQGQGSTQLTLTGRIIGAYAAWLKRLSTDSVATQNASIDRVSFTESSDGSTRTYLLTLGLNVSSVMIHYRTVPIDDPDDAFDFSESGDDSNTPNLIILNRVPGSTQASFSLPHPPRGFRVAGRMVPYTAAPLVEGDNWLFEIEPAPPAVNANIHPSKSGTLASLTIDIGFGVSDGPVQVDVYEYTGTSETDILSLPGVTAPVTLTPGSYPALGNRTLPSGKDTLSWRVLITDVNGEQYWFGPATAGRDPLPTGTPTLQNYRPAPIISCPFDPDTTQIKYTSALGKTKTFNQAALASLGSPVTYTVGDVLDDLTTETLLVVDEDRGPCKVEYTGGGTTTTMWQGDLHGTPSNPPTGKVRIVTSADGSTEDGYVVVDSPVGELLRVFYRDGDSSGAIVYGLVTSAIDPTPLYVSALTEVGPSNYFKDIDGTGAILQVLSAVSLTRDQIKRSAIQVQGKDSGVTSSWIPMTFSLLAQPWCESFSLSFDESTNTLSGTLAAGAHTQSAFFEFADNPSFTSPTTFSANVADGATSVQSFVLSGAQLGKVWYGRVTPFNEVSLGGLDGVPQLSQVAVPAAWSVVGTPTESAGVGTVTLVVDDPGSLFDQTHVDGPVTSAISWHITRSGVYTVPEASDTQPGGGATTGTWTKNVTLDPLHNITVVALGHFIDGSTEVLGSWTFDSNKVSDLANSSVAYNGNTATVKLNWDTDTAIGAGCMQYSLDSGVTWTAAAVASDLTSSFNVTRTGSNQVILVQGKNALGGAWGNEASVIVSAYIADGPTLSVVTTPGGSSYSLAWTGTGTVTLSIDGGTATTPPSSPIVVDLDSSTHVYHFEATLAGQTVPQDVHIPILPPPSITDIVCNAAYFPNDGGGSFDISWSTFNIDPSCTFEITFVVTAGNYMGPGGPYNGKSQTGVSSGDTISYPFATQPSLNLTVIAKDINGLEVGRGTFVDQVAL